VVAYSGARPQGAAGAAQEIVAAAQADAERIAVEAKAKMEDFVARRTKSAENKIAQAETQAVADVRAAAAEAAASAAASVLSQTVKGDVANGLIEKSIKELGSKLN
jgi:F-type H+-transporting ATPase subunit b